MAKTEYKFECDENIAKETIMQFLQANNYKEQVTKDGKKYYQYSDAMVIGFLEYEIENGMVTVYAYLRSEKKPMPLDDSFVGALPKSHYKGIIEPLLKALGNPDGESIDKKSEIVDEEPKKEVETVSVNQEKNDTYNQFADESQKSKEKFAVAAFVISLVGLVLSCFGFAFGLIIIFLEYYFAIQGLKTKKKGLAITAIVLASVSLLINILAIIIGVMIG